MPGANAPPPGRAPAGRGPPPVRGPLGGPLRCPGAPTRAPTDGRALPGGGGIGRPDGDSGRPGGGGIGLPVGDSGRAGRGGALAGALAAAPTVAGAGRDGSRRAGTGTGGLDRSRRGGRVGRRAPDEMTRSAWATSAGRAATGRRCLGDDYLGGERGASTRGAGGAGSGRDRALPSDLGGRGRRLDAATRSGSSDRSRPARGVGARPLRPLAAAGSAGVGAGASSVGGDRRRGRWPCRRPWPCPWRRPRRRGLLGGRLLGRLLRRLRLLGLLVAGETVANGAAPDHVGVRLVERRRVALHRHAERAGEIHRLGVRHPELLGQLVHPHVLRHASQPLPIATSLSARSSSSSAATR